jgi:hypothetical protein
MGTAPLRDPLQTGVALDIESQPKATVSNWAQMVGARTTVGVKAAILAIGTRGTGRPRASLGALFLFNDDSAQTERWKE